MEAVAEDTRTALETSVLEAYREERSPAEPAWLSEIRGAGFDRFRAAGFPGPRDESWKYTNVAPILRVPFAAAGEPRRPGRGADVGVFSDEGPRIVFVNGRYAATLSSAGPPAGGVEVTSLRDALSRQPASVQPHLAKIAREGNAFADVNTALFEDGAFVRISAGAVLPDPIHLVFLSEPGSSPTVSHVRNLVVAERGSQAAIVESWVGEPGGLSFTNAVTEVAVGEGAVLEFYKLERESLDAFHVATMEVLQKRDSSFTSHSITLGGALVRNDLNVRLDAPGAGCTLNGLFLGSGTQHLDNHTRIDHAEPHGTSRELYKGIMSGKSRGVFNGRIIVRPDAQKTDAMQTNRNLLLSKEALVNSEPALEIFADDVKCRHGSTIGQLDETAMFYLRSRGIGEEDARSLLVYAFASDVASRIRIAPLRAMVEEHLGLRLAGSGGGDLPEARP